MAKPTKFQKAVLDRMTDEGKETAIATANERMAKNAFKGQDAACDQAIADAEALVGDAQEALDAAVHPVVKMTRQDYIAGLTSAREAVVNAEAEVKNQQDLRAFYANLNTASF
tara:strand:- start:64 stop:402 length:339 start_codon:yes stop_codon:yes gene_type:complete